MLFSSVIMILVEPFPIRIPRFLTVIELDEAAHENVWNQGPLCLVVTVGDN